MTLIVVFNNGILCNMLTLSTAFLFLTIKKEKLMKLLKIVVDGLPLFKEKIDICFFAQQRVSEEQRDYLYPLFSTVFLNTTNVPNFFKIITSIL